MYRSDSPDVITKVITHVLGDDKETYDHFTNWLAYIYQSRDKSGTAWVLHGCPGTGKGVLFNNIIRPIFGDDYCQTKQIRDIKDHFNGWMETAIFVNIDEANSEDAGRESKEIVNALKQWITDPIMSVRHMRATAVNRRSFINFIFTTNDFGVLPIQDGDRRFSVAPRQETPISLTPDEIAAIRGELQHFAGYLSGYKADEVQAHTPLVNRAKDDLKTAAESSIDSFFRAIREGNLRYFTDGTNEHSNEYESLAAFRMAVDEWIADAKAFRPSRATTAQLKHAHIVLCRDKSMKTNAFMSMCAKRGTAMKRCRDAEQRWTGRSIEWKIDDDMKRDLKVHIQAVKTPEDIEAEIAGDFKTE